MKKKIKYGKLFEEEIKPLLLGHPEAAPNTTNSVHIHESAQIRILEEEDGDGEDKVLLIRLIKEGLSRNNHYFSKEVAESVADFMMDRPQMYMDHSYWGSRSWNELVAVAQEAYKEDGASFAKVKMVENPMTSWIYKLARDFEGIVDVSIDASVKMRQAEAEDGRLWDDENYDPETVERPVWIIEEIKFLHSVDFVTYGAAGGKVLDIVASEGFNPVAMRELAQIVEEFQSNLGNVEKSILNSRGEKSMEIKDMTSNDLVRENPSLVASIKEDARRELETSSKANEEVEELNGIISTVTKENDTLKESVKSLQDKVDAFEADTASKKRTESIEKLIEDSGLAKDQISEAFMKSLDAIEDMDLVKEAIDDRVSLFPNEEDEEDSSGVIGNGERQPDKVVENEVKPFDTTKLVSEVKNSKNNR